MLQSVALQSNVLKQKYFHTEQSTNKIIGKRIAALRGTLGLSQEDFAKKLGITRGKLSQIEIGRTEIGIELLQTLVTNCSTTYDEIIDGKKPGSWISHKQLTANEPSVKYEDELSRLRIENATLREALREIGKGIKS